MAVFVRIVGFDSLFRGLHIVPQVHFLHRREGWHSITTICRDINI